MGTFGRTLLGLFTITAMVAGGWYMLNILKTGDLTGENIRLILRFSDAHGVPVGGTVRHKGVHVGEVLNVDVAPDDSGVIMTVSIAPRFQHTLRRSSKFWIVRPHFGGLTKGVSGLDTLIKDPYVEYSTPDHSSPVINSGTVVFGLNLPPHVGDSDLFNQEHGRNSSVEFKVKFPSAQGLREGAPVVYRDIQVGTVRGVDLALDGRYVEVLVLLRGRYRETARTDSVFWVAKPNVEFGLTWPKLVNIRDISKLLTGAALAYATPLGSSGTPLKNGDLISGADKPPDVDERLQGPLVPIEPVEGDFSDHEALKKVFAVGVSFSFIEEDLFSDINQFFQGTGLLFAGPKGEVCVLTARTLADGAFSVTDLFSGPDIQNSDLKVLLTDRSICEAKLVWSDPDEKDLAVLELMGEGLPAPGELPQWSTHEEPGEYYFLIAFRENLPGMRRIQPIPADKVDASNKETLRLDPELRLDIPEWCGAIMMDMHGNLAGVLGREEALSDDVAVHALTKAPDWNVSDDGEAAHDG